MDMETETKSVLDRFCSFLQGGVGEPFVFGGFAYATTGACCLRVPDPGPDTEHKHDRERKMAQAASEFPHWADFALADGWVPVPTEGQWKLSYGRCPQMCSAPFPDPEKPGVLLSFDCEICDGTGRVMDGGSLKIGEQWFAVGLLCRFLENMENPECRLGTGAEPLRIRGAGGYEGLLMPLDVPRKNQ